MIRLQARTRVRATVVAVALTSGSAIMGMAVAAV